MASYTEWIPDDLVFLERMKALEEIAQVAKVMDEWFGAGGEPVAQELSAHRAEVCAKCPNNIKGNSWWEKGKSAAAGVVRKHIETKHYLKLHTPHDKDLHTCDVCGCVLKLKVHVPLWFAAMDMTDEQKRRFHKVRCWLTEEQGENNELR